MLTIILQTAAAQPAGNGLWSMLIMFVLIFAVMYFFMIRPQQKEQKNKQAMISAIEVGDTVLTTSGFYGTIIDLSDESTVIIEFGNNRNCRIPMQRAAIAAVEKPEEAAKASDEKKDKK